MRNLFIDDLLSATKINGIEGDIKPYQKFLIDSQVFLIQNIINSVPENIDFSNLQIIALPFPDCWFEWTFDIIRKDDQTNLFAGEIDDKLLDSLLNLEGFFRVGVNLISEERTEDGWGIFSYIYLRSTNFPVLRLPINFKIQVDNDGFYRYHKKLILGNPDSVFSKITENLVSDDVIDQLLYVALFALGLLHCKNVKTIERGGQPAFVKGRHHNHKWMRRHHVLQIHPLQDINNSKSLQLSEKTISFHFCRGHFKTYTEEKPLFGKYIGTYWWNSHTRGSYEIGIVTKDYNLNN